MGFGYWEQDVRWLQVMNMSDEEVPPYGVVIFDGDDQPLQRIGRQLIYPVNIAGFLASPPTYEQGHDGLAMINGPQPILPGRFGRASIDFPLPVLVDPESAGGDAAWNSFEAGEFGQCGPVDESFIASFSPDIPLWQTLGPGVQEDGTYDWGVAWVNGLYLPARTYNSNEQQLSYNGTPYPNEAEAFSFSDFVRGTYLITMNVSVNVQQPGTMVLIKFKKNDDTLATAATQSILFSGYVVDTDTNAMGSAVSNNLPLVLNKPFDTPGVQQVTLFYHVYLEDDDEFTITVEASQSSQVNFMNGNVWWYKLDSYDLFTSDKNPDLT